MAAATKERPALLTDSSATEPWRMPKPMGGTVLWNAYERGRRAQVNDCMGIVTRITDSSVDMVIFPAGGQPQQKFGVKFCGDPRLGAISFPAADGVWDFTPLEKAIRDLIADSRV